MFFVRELKTTMEQQTNMNWMEEAKKLTDGGVYFKLVKDTPYTVVFLDEGRQYEKLFPEQKEPKTCIDFKVRVTGGGLLGKEMVWTITRGQGVRTSLFGKLAQLFSRNGCATGLSVDVVAVGDAQARKYEIKQYNELLFSQGKK